MEPPLSNPELQEKMGAYGKATLELLAYWLAALSDEDPRGGMDLLHMVQHGGFITIASSVSPFTRVQSCVLSVTDKAGKTSHVSEVEFK